MLGQVTVHFTVENVRMYQAGGDLTVHEAPADRQAQQAERALTDYLRALRSTSGALQLSRIDAEEARFSTAMRLEQVYIRLNVERQVKLTEAEIAALPKMPPGTLRGKS